MAFTTRLIYYSVFILALLEIQLLSATNAGIFASNSSSSGSGRSSNTCSTNLHRCDNGRCIPMSWLCDGDNDCGNGGDELNCEQKQCQAGEYRCNSTSKCIPLRWLCDSEPDCTDGSDEHPEECANRKCEEGRYQCPTGVKCIPQTWVCDTQKDCENGEDEANCTTIGGECSSQEYKCKNGRCIFKRWLCDMDDDCGDMSDEHAQCDYTCGELQLKCEKDHKCIPKRWQCDGEMDCLDGSDEVNCMGIHNRLTNVTCHGYEFRCDDGVCIHNAWLCDGESDCPDKSDEKHCSNRNCTAEQFSCTKSAPYECVPSAYRCNGIIDCTNGEDEKNCPTPKPPKPCSPTEFDCGDNFCIPLDQLCNGKYDCPRNTTSGLHADEPPVQKCAHEKCTAKSCHPTAICINTTFGSMCTCPWGYQRNEKMSNKTYLVCDDTDECTKRPPVCGQKCHNTPGSFTCGCRQGYVLSRDKKNCRALGDKAKILFSHRSTINQIDLYTGRGNPMINNLTSAVSMDFRFGKEKKTIVWSDVDEEVIYSFETTKDLDKIDADKAKSQSKILASGLHTPDGLAVDWIHGLIYWTDTGFNIISVVDLDGKYRKTLIEEHLDEPRAIAIDPVEGLLFWTDWGEHPKIERAWLDGTNRMTIVDTQILWPNGLALDLVDRRVFWADAKLKTVMSADYDGKNPVVVLTSAQTLRHPFSLAIFEEKIYWTDWETDGIHWANKYTGVESLAPLMRKLTGPMAIRVYHEQSQPQGPNKCVNTVCDQLCLPTWSDPSHPGTKSYLPYTCQCADEYLLCRDGRSCTFNGTLPPNATTVPTSKPAPQSASGNRGGQTAVVTLAWITCFVLMFALVGYIIWRRVYKNQRRPKRMTLDTPVYRRAFTDGDAVNGQQYDHLRLSIDSEQNSSRGSGVYQPTTTVASDPEVMGVGVVQNGKYSMRLPLTENEEGPDYA